jgi:hypothetical protein
MDQETFHARQRELLNPSGQPELPSRSNQMDPEPPPHHAPARQPARFSRRKLLIAGSATAGLVTASALGVLELHKLLQKHGTDVLGSFRHLGNQRQAPPAIQPPYTTPQDLIIFSGKLSPNWNDWSWPHSYPVSRAPLFTDGTSVIQFSPANGNAVYLSHAPLKTAGYGFLQFWAHGGLAGGQQLIAGMVDQTYSFSNEPSINPYIQGGFLPANQWSLVRIPLTALQSADTLIGGIIIRDASGTLQPDLFLADIRLVHLPNPNRPQIISGDSLDLASVLLFFDRQMLADDVTLPRFYQISSLEDGSYFRPLEPGKANYDATHKSVSLVVPAPLQDGKHYLVSVGRVRSVDGPMLSDASSVTVTAHTLEVQIDISARGPAISPYIYGVNVLENPGVIADLRPRLNRWGGTQTSRYNWKLGNAFNAGNDYYFENGNYGYTSPADTRPSGVVDQFVAKTLTAGVDSLVSIPALGWVAKDTNPASRSVNPGQGTPPLHPGSDITVFGYDPTANRQRTSVPSRARKGAPFSDPPNLGDSSVAQDEWVNHLTRRFGQASNGGVKFYAIDNEPELWQYLERDVRPIQLSYEDMRDFFLDYGTAIKDVDSSAMVTAPVIWGWSNYFYSSLDRGIDNFKTKPDFHAHNDTPFLIWWMDQIRQHDEKAGRRTLDVLDLHFFSQALGVYYQPRTDADGRALRLRATRSLWDKTYKDESWINDYIYLIPRMLSWISQSYPGTKFGLSEYSWGGDTTMNGGLAEAELLGIFGREGLYFACFWANPKPGTPVYNAIKMYTNFDSQGGWFDGTSISATTTRPELLSCYATERANGDVLLMVLNKHEQATLTPTIHLPHVGARHITSYSYSASTGQTIAPGESLTMTDESLRFSFPAYSITLLKLAKA